MAREYTLRIDIPDDQYQHERAVWKRKRKAYLAIIRDLETKLQISQNETIKTLLTEQQKLKDYIKQLEHSLTQSEQPINQTINLLTKELPRLEREHILTLIAEQLDTFNTQEANRTTTQTSWERQYDSGYHWGYKDALYILKRAINKQLKSHT